MNGFRSGGLRWPQQLVAIMNLQYICTTSTLNSTARLAWPLVTLLFTKWFPEEYLMRCRCSGRSS